MTTRRLAAALALLLAVPASASAETRTITLFSRAHRIPAYQAVQQVEAPVASPGEVAGDGYVTGVVADVVAIPRPTARALPIRKVMLHHIVFARLGHPDRTCGWPIERFYAEGEEHATFTLPPGYGYANAASDRWLLLWMLMNHSSRDETVWVRYRVTYVTGETLREVHPYWLDVANCNSDPVFGVPGTGPAGSVYHRSTDVVVPEAGRIVAAGGHVHGGGLSLNVSDQTCAGRTLYESRPTWGFASDPYYTVRPILHEAGPIHMGQFTASPGLSVAAGDTLRLTAGYDDSRPHSRVMGITVLMLAPDPAVAGCPPLDDAGVGFAPSPPGRRTPPRVAVPLFFTPTGPFERLRNVSVASPAFLPGRVEIRRGQTLTWHFTDTTAVHNITFAGGPRGAAEFESPPMPLKPAPSSYSHTFTRRGVYRLFCSLHPAAMTELVRVR